MDLSHVKFGTDRHITYKDYENMFSNNEDAWLKLRKLNNIGTHPLLAIALPREVAILYSDMAFSTPINAFAKDNEEADKALDDIIENNSLDMMLSEASLSTAYKGGVVFKNYLDEGVSKISYVEPDFYFPKFSKFDKRKIELETLAFPFVENKREYVFTETYEKRNGEYWVTTATYLFKSNKIEKLVGESTSINTKLTESPLTYVPLIRNGSNFWGDSMYKALTPLFDSLNHRVTQIADILDRHSDPNMYADPSFFEDDGNFESGGKAYPVDHGKGEKPPGYITWEWSADANFKFIEDIIFKALSYVSPLAPALYGLDNTSQASGRALLLKSWRTQCMVTRSHTYWREALKKILYKAQQLQVIAGNGKYTPAIPNVELKLNIPTDFYEMAQSEQLKVTSKTSSIKSSISRLNPHYTSKQVEEEFLEIINEQNEINNLTFMTDPTQPTGGT
ncbi:phage portal protein [Evansella tamaricis]|uniref:Phage portal protein n=1 Tax=Evansella tamaricis TaxID=2069301 RepID=A0ABS6JQ60_9BACI|nr:phage portal protein [Evansella tamaricis]MBU9714428.1 phage portal protein [Evansella tamaricis]